MKKHSGKLMGTKEDGYCTLNSSSKGCNIRITGVISERSVMYKNVNKADSVTQGDCAAKQSFDKVTVPIVITLTILE